MEEQIKALPVLAKDKENIHKKFFSLLKRKPPKKLDGVMIELHEREFTKTDCLKCANCCKTTGPLFTQKDLLRIAKYLRMKPNTFMKQYLRLDEDQDWVLQTLPCPFLDSDNRCSIYDVRPKACREFPHTDRKKFQQITHLTLKNVAICPAAFNIVESLRNTIDTRKTP